MNLTDFLDAIGVSNTARPGTHTTNPGLSSADIAAWEALRSVRLPSDFVALLERSNGVALHQSWFRGMPMFDGGAFHIYGLADLKRADVAMYGPRTSPIDSMSEWLAIGEGPDSALFFVFDVAARTYLAVSPITPQEFENLGSSINALFALLDPSNPEWVMP